VPRAATQIAPYIAEQGGDPLCPGDQALSGTARVTSRKDECVLGKYLQETQAGENYQPKGDTSGEQDTMSFWQANQEATALEDIYLFECNFCVL